MKVLIYTLSTCPWCKKTKKWFSDRNIQYDYIDFDLASDDEKAMIKEQCKKNNLTLSFPIVYIDERVIQGYNPDKYASLVKL